MAPNNDQQQQWRRSSTRLAMKRQAGVPSSPLLPTATSVCPYANHPLTALPSPVAHYLPISQQEEGRCLAARRVYKGAVEGSPLSRPAVCTPPAQSRMVALSVGVAAVAGDTVAAAHPVATTPAGCFFMQHPCAVIVDQLKERLPLVIENGDQEAALGIISSLEKLGLTKEVLEVTRVGAVVNEARKKAAGAYPELSKRCRILIKAWQRTVADSHRPLSSCEGSSNGGTPNLVSPALRSNNGSKVVPASGKRKSTSSTTTTSSSGLHVTYAAESQRSTKVSPSLNGSYAPRKVSPCLQKSQSVGTTLFSLREEEAVAVAAGDVAVEHDPEQQCSLDSLPSTRVEPLAGVKRKGEEPPIPTLTLKRAKLGGGLVIGVSRAGGSASSSPGFQMTPTAGGLHSVTAARKNVQSTAELVALVVSENLPQHMAGIGMKLSAGSTSPPVTGVGVGVASATETIWPTTTLHHSASASYLPAAATLMKENGHEEEEEAAVPQVIETTTNGDATNGRSPTPPPPPAASPVKEKKKRSKEEKQERRERKEKKRREREERAKGGEEVEPIVEAEEIPSITTTTTTTTIEEPSVPSAPGSSVDSTGKGSFDWFAQLVPSLEALRARSPDIIPPPPRSSTTRPFVIPIRQRRLVAMPYVDIGVPDFLLEPSKAKPLAAPAPKRVP